jgi:hypothetical protein
MTRSTQTQSSFGTASKLRLCKRVEANIVNELQICAALRGQAPQARSLWFRIRYSIAHHHHRKYEMREAHP